MKTIKPHIRSQTQNNILILQVTTWELKNFVEDFLAEKSGIVYDYYEEINSDLKDINGESYNLYFSSEFSADNIEQQISNLNDKEIEAIVSFQQIQAKGKFYCPCCGYNTMTEPPSGTYDICKICYWEDDPIQLEDPYYEGGANRVSLKKGQENFEEFGACEREMIKNVTRPSSKDIRNPNLKKYH
ncbi:CPCC family cysteine-rich protein [Telluribacter sp. SYSU D00476]|uniref:CPCC family cysteine-rich protein n=1 Tax=Telluribacter sp. SYSU D00476 TaxID=2811430 RepID=UPI001FF15FA8|nr:CPCC family cysteine-rich protein [Telluribacter sp. SYSU D00476]